MKKPESILREGLKLGTAPIVASGVFSLISNLLFLAFPIYTNIIYSRVLISQNVSTLIVLTIAIIFVFVVSGALDVIRQQILIDFGIVFDRYVSGRVFNALFEGVASRRLSPQSQALRDLDQFRSLIAGQAVSILFDVPWIPIFLIALIIINPLIGIIGCIGGVTLIILAWLQDRVTRAAYESGEEQSISSYSFTDAALRNAEVVRAMGMMQTIGHEWAKLRNSTNDRSGLAFERANTYSNIIKVVRFVVQILIIAAGAWLIMEQKVPPGMLFANMIISGRALQPIDRLVGSWQSLIAGKNAYDRLEQLLAGQEPPRQATALPRPTGVVSVSQMGFAMPGAPRLLLSNLNFELGAGETLGVVGPSGAGKSTLARMLVGVWKPFAGHIRLDGAEVFGWDREQFGRYVGYLPQDVELFAGTVRDNIGRFRSDIDDADVIAAARAANAHDLILSLAKGYDTELGEGGAVLSAGQRQRVGLARALFGNPALVVLDEPNAALDSVGEEALLSALSTMKAAGTTVVIVSHKASIFRSADKILVLKEGRVEAFGTRDEIFAQIAQPVIPPQPAPQGQTPPAASVGQQSESA